ncbi:MAG: DctP family TRAP transporter solute-binding subunit [Spirochaetales bacterium]|jgi:C4-dicarboxylate-binding protein DctP|nr:DctP family TRAP transporter solute-binding subunit [Spirochaetales bacterium]
MKKTGFRKVCALLMVLGMVFLAFSCGGSAPQQAQAGAAQSSASAGQVLQPIDTTLPSPPVTLRVSYDDPVAWPGTPNVNVADPEHAFGALFKDYVEVNSGGAIKVELYGGMALGSYRQTLEMVQNGSLDINIGTGSLGSFFPKIELITIPYLFSSDDIAEEFFNNSPLWAQLMEDMEKEAGFKYLAVGQNGWRNFTNNIRPIKGPEDCKGIKFRVMESPVYVKMIESLGASAVPIAWNELYTALQTKVVDGEENPISSINLGKIYEVQKYITMDGHIWSENIMVMNPAKFNGLPVAAQQIIKRGAILGAQANNVAERMVSNIVKFKVVADHMEVYMPTAADKQKFREVTQPAVLDYLKGRVGAELVDSFIKEVQLAETRAGWRR